jgi:hypothetical protein
MKRIGREAWILGLIMIVFVAVTARYAGRDYTTEQRKQPSSFNTAPGGLAALFRLFERNKLPVRRWERPLTALPNNAGLIVIAEPFWRDMSREEQAALDKWTEAGHAVLYIVSQDVLVRQPADDEEQKSKAVEIIRATGAPADIAPPKSDSPYLKDVRTIHVEGKIRLAAAGAEALAKDSKGAYALVTNEGEGQTIAITDGLRIDNAGIASVDNALLFLNIGIENAGDGILFDEYHHGYGAESGGRSLWQAIGTAARACALYLLAAFLLVIYNANRRFGAMKRIAIPTSRPSTEYVSSMGALYRRAGAARVALDVIRTAFVRDISNRLDLTPDASAGRVADVASRRFGIDAAELRETLEQGERAGRGERLSEQELTLAARRIQEYRRKAGL